MKENCGLQEMLVYLNHSTFDALQQSSGATGASSTLKNVGVDKGPTDIGVTRTSDLVYGIKLENFLFIFKKYKAELLINLYD